MIRKMVTLLMPDDTVFEKPAAAYMVMTTFAGTDIPIERLCEEAAQTMKALVKQDGWPGG